MPNRLERERRRLHCIFSSRRFGEVVMTCGLLKNNHSGNANERVLSLNSRQAAAATEEIENGAKRNNRGLHAETLYEDFLEETRAAFANVVSIMNHRSDSMPDAFVRHHLVAVTREVAEIGRALLEKAQQDLTRKPATKAYRS